jgi:predicted Zn-dependent protease
MLKTPQRKRSAKAASPTEAGQNAKKLDDASLAGAAEENRPKAGSPDGVTEALNGAGLSKGALAKAMAAWEAARATAANEEAAVQSLVQRLRSDKHHAPAEAVARLAMNRFTGAAWPLVEIANMRARAGDDEASLSYARQLVTAFPDEPEGHRLTITALLALDRKDEAQAFFQNLSLDPAQHTLHRVEWFLMLGIKLAMQRSDYNTVVLYAAALREVAPDNISGYVGGAAGLRELERPSEAQDVASQGIERHPKSPLLWKELALAAQDLNLPDLAYERWDELTARFPASASGYIGALNLSTKLAQPMTTQVLLERALKAFPDNPYILGTAARLALRSNRITEANTHWQKLLEQAPEDPSVPLAAAMSLMARRRGRIKRLPDALRRLEALHVDFPDYVPAYSAHLSVLREASKIGEAVKYAGEWSKRFPNDQDLAIAHAMIAEEREEYEEALTIIAGVRGRTPPSAKCEAAYVRALCLADRMDEAESACQSALADFPYDAPILTENVRIATRRGEWADALRRALDAQRRRPRDPAMMKLVQSIRAQVVDDDELNKLLAGSAMRSAGSAAGAEATEAETAVLLSCESLGATSAGCEFGLVQRRFGAEPFGMFRWALIGIDRLTEALRNEFADVGSDATTELAIRRESATHQEYYVVDKKVGYLTHTFVKVEDSPADRMLKQSVRRVRFLRSKLIEDLHAAEKIFIYKYATKFDEAALRTMFAAVRSYGPCTLLCVTLADSTHPRGSIEMLEPGLFVGRTGMFMDAVVPEMQGVDTETWFAHCQHVVAWHAANRAKPS